MKSIKDYLKKYSPEQITRNKYYYDELINFFGNDIPEKYIQLYENCNLLNDEFISENLQSHDAEKLKAKLKKEYGNSISFQDYSGENNKSFIIILNDDNLLDFYNPNNDENVNFEKIEKFNNILSFFNYYVSYNDEDKGKKYLFIEPRYSDDVSNSIFNSHKYLYHFTDKRNGRRILETGLRIRKSNYREYPERIFLYVTDKKIEDDLQNISKFILQVCNIYNIKRYGLSILRIENNGKLNLYNDTAMKEDEAIFTYQNIPYQWIKNVNINLSYEDLNEFKTDNNTL